MNKITRKINKLKQDARNSIESDSLTSLFLPWEHHHRHINFTNIQTGRVVDPSEFYLFFISVTFLILAVCQMGLAIWSLTSKISLNYLIDSSTELAYAIIPSACFLFPSFWLTCSIHNDVKSQKYLPLVLILLSFSVSFTATATYLGFDHHLRKYPPEDEIINKEFKKNMQKALGFYNGNKQYKKAWDSVQMRFSCYGIEDDNNNRGCLRPVIKFLLWQINLLSGLNCVTLVILCCWFIAITSVYFVNRNSKNQDERI